MESSAEAAAVPLCQLGSLWLGRPGLRVAMAGELDLGAADPRRVNVAAAEGSQASQALGGVEVPAARRTPSAEDR
jgi:hypothetical protein